MPLVKSKGNMYPWVTHMHTHLNGKCPFACPYCYVQTMANRFPAMKAKYSGPLRIDERELQVKYGKGKTIFIEHMNDIFECPHEMTERILKHCNEWPDNTYVFQSKKPVGFYTHEHTLPPKRILGTTLESNRCFGFDYKIESIEDVRFYNETFITIEPVMKFDTEEFLESLLWARPSFINIGADSKGRGLDEPTRDELLALIKGIQDAGIEIRQKRNLQRILGV